jgi:hypothetical protein
MEDWDQSSFVTLTYDDDNVPPDFSISKTELQKFIKRLRKTLSTFHRTLKYYGCGEYGSDQDSCYYWIKYGHEEGRPHYHIILFGVASDESEMLSDLWNRGSVYTGSVTFDSCRYVAGYIDKKYYGKKKDEQYTSKNLENPFQLCSQGLGLKFAVQNKDQFIAQGYTTVKGIKFSIPRYYRDKLGLDPEIARTYVEDKILEQNLSLLNKGIAYVSTTADGHDTIVVPASYSADRHRQKTKTAGSKAALMRQKQTKYNGRRQYS